MKSYEITNENVGYYSDNIWLPTNATQEEINDALENVEMDISIDWGEGWNNALYEALHFDYESPYTLEIGETSLTGYLDLRKFCETNDISLNYTDAWGIKQDKIPLIIRAIVGEREND